jgi:hypothetical protein
MHQREIGQLNRYDDLRYDPTLPIVLPHCD